MNDISFKSSDRVLVLGATGFIGRRLVHKLQKESINTRILVRSQSKAASLFSAYDNIEIVSGDVLKGDGLNEALTGVHTVFYLIHSMGGSSLLKKAAFAEKDKEAARNFISAADVNELKRVIYLGGLGETGKGLSEHLKSRTEIAEILSQGTAEETFLRAAVIIGAGGASFEMLRHLVERLPIMICPKWINTKIQPIAVRDVISYLVGCLLNPETSGKRFDICGPDIFTYKDMMHQYAEARGLAKRLIIDVPVLTPHMSSYWVDLITPVPSGIAHPLIEGMKNEVVCKEKSIENYVQIEQSTFIEAVKTAFAEETTGPGVTGF